MVYVALVVSPKRSDDAPDVPGTEDLTIGPTCQHSKMDSPLLALMAVRFRYVSVWFSCAMAEPSRRAACIKVRMSMIVEMSAVSLTHNFIESWAATYLNTGLVDHRSRRSSTMAVFGMESHVSLTAGNQ